MDAEIIDAEVFELETRGPTPVPQPYALNETQRRALAQLEHAKLDNIDLAILSLIAEHPTWSDKMIGCSLRMSGETVRQRQRKPAFMQAMVEQQATLKDLIILGQETAIRKLIEIARGHDKGYALQACRILSFPAYAAAAHKLGFGQGAAPGEAMLFQTRIGGGGQVLREQSDLPSIDVIPTAHNASS